MAKFRARPAKVRAAAPAKLMPEQVARLRSWCEGNPATAWAVSVLPDLIETCLDHHRAAGNLMSDWEAAVRTWIRREQQFASKAKRARAVPGVGQTAPAPFVAPERKEPNVTSEQMQEAWKELAELGSPLARKRLGRMDRPR